MICGLLSNRRLSQAIAMSMMAVLFLGLKTSKADEPKTGARAKKVSKQTVIRISKETTRITEPLDNEGYVDYVQALNDRYSKDVTPQNNYEVVVRSVMPPTEISEPIRQEYFSRLGIPVPDEQARFYQDFITFTVDGKKDQMLTDGVIKEHDVIVSQPWTAADHPRAAKWVRKFGDDLDKLVEGSKRAKFYTPYIAGEVSEAEPYPRVISLLLPSAQQQRDIARGLSIRAMGRIGAGDLDGAWNDLQAMHRVARHVGQGFSLIENLVGIAINAMAFQGEIQILKSPKLTVPQIKRFLANSQAQKPLPPMADNI
ncbi:MAG: hypothetical protein KDA84_09830, partial [Planctomycetaceae bacterium]|nr:hypothetical protein [Planctomycetaceae bacterium]